MALSNAERQRRHYERRKAAAKVTSDATELTRPFLGRPYCAFVGSDSDWDQVEIPLRLAGIEPPRFDDDRGPVFAPGLEGLELPTHLTDSVGRAELMVECLLDAASALAASINRYKRAEITEALSNIRRAAGNAAALTDADQLEHLLERLNKRVRWSLPEWKVKEG
ncbi:MAG: hypothetical protein EOR86_04170 [Mesorhizobium sp.]|uniref:hypothetical protein n=1 Tax=Mesorhizobium sp. TaxID=1871066 RepID=UPI000FEA820F|nr:hypothetical protein [Mesorhizobium sp.]RWN01056.1 MAG: hypothetical protein EOR86_04170 [Mesorhizobium sp.]